MNTIGLTETMDALRAELGEAIKNAAGQAVQFPVGAVEPEFHVGVTRGGEGKAGIRFWVVELGAGGTYNSESIQRVTIKLDPPVDADGNRVLVARGSDDKP